MLSLEAPGASLPDPTTLLSAVRLASEGTGDAQNVQVTSIAVEGATLTSPASLPLNLGSIHPGGFAVLNADFAGTFTPLGTYPLEVMGTYESGGNTYCFDSTADLDIPPAAPGTSAFNSVDVPSHTNTGAPFPPQPPEMDGDVNTARWTVPIAPSSPGTPTATETTLTPAPIGDPPAIVFEANNSLGLTSSGVGCSGDPQATCAEPSGGVSAAGLVFATANWSAAYSTDGSSFTTLDPTTVFPADAVGFCCDQIVQYVPSIDRVVWLLQGGSTGGYRLAVASPAQILSSGGTAWTYWNLTPGVFGQPGISFDYPDLSVGNNELYISWDAGVGCSSCDWGFQVARTSLSGLAAGGTITIEYTDPADGRMDWGSHLSQNTGDTIFWAGHKDNTHLRVFSALESEGVYSWRDVGITGFATGPLSSTTPDGQDWMTKLADFPGNSVIGATRVFGNEVWFAWSAGTDDNFPQPHIEMVAIDPSNGFHKDQQVQIWNGNYAFGYPSLSTNACTGEIGMSFEYGGNGNYENHVVGFWGDYIAYITTASDAGSDRYGDYVTIRQVPYTADNPGNLFSAFGFGVNSTAGGGKQTDVRYVLFGRPASSCQIIE